MTEKQKMLMGIIYNAEETSLIEERNRAKSLTKQYNESRQEDRDYRKYLMGQILDGGGVEIGNRVFIGPNVGIYTVNHPTDARRREKGYEWALPVKIGNKVWIGGGVTILPGVTIGDNTVIAAGSVVTQDVPANVVAAGNPCKVIKEAEKGDRYGIIDKKDGE